MSAPETYELRDAIASAMKVIKHRQSARLSVKGKLVTLPSSGDVIVVGDIHGDRASLEHILRETGFEEHLIDGDDLHLLCLGDYIDRGPAQIQVLYRLLRLLESHPYNVILLRGNHEGPRDVPFHPHDFPMALRAAYGPEATDIYMEFRDLCDELYTAAVAPRRILFLHGGVPVKLEGLNDLAYAHMEHPTRDNLLQILWNDPVEQDGFHPNPRGVGYLFGPDIVENAFRAIDVSTLIRSHQSCDGYAWLGGTLTLFSCKLPHYGNRSAAYLKMPLSGGLPRYEESYIHLF